jgi:stage III sporulation protein AG
MKSLDEYKSLSAKLFHKYKYILLIAAVGLLLIFWPSGKIGGAAPAPAVSQTAAYDAIEMEKKLESLLAKAKGVGRVEVILSLKSGMEYDYANDSSRSADHSYAEGFMTGSQEEESSQTVILRDAEGNENPLLVRQTYPEYLGALVVCDGADNASVRLRVAQAISSLTGIPYDRIVVIKMEG